MRRNRENLPEPERKEAFPTAWTGLLCLSAVYIVLGVLLLVMPQISLPMICQVLGIVLVIAGAICILVYFLRRQYEIPGRFGFAAGTACVLLGIFALLCTAQVAFAFSQILAICVVGDCLVKLQYATDLLRLYRRNWFVALLLALGLSALALIALANPFGSDSVRLPFTYGVLIADGVTNVGVVIYLHAAYRGQRQMEDEAVYRDGYHSGAGEDFSDGFDDFDDME